MVSSRGVAAVLLCVALQAALVPAFSFWSYRSDAVNGNSTVNLLSRWKRASTGGMKEVTLAVNFASPLSNETERNATTKIIKKHLNAAILRQYPSSSPVIDVLKIYRKKCKLSVQLTYSDPSECEAMKAHFNGSAVLSGYSVDVQKNDVCPTAPTGGSASTGTATSCTPIAGDGYFRCSNGNCVEEVTLCDGFDNCGDNSDEDPLTCRCRPHHLCDNGTSCVSVYDVCDGVPQCSDGSDEQGCGCPVGQRSCLGGKMGAPCVNLTDVCDGKRDCPGDQDEAPQLCGACGSNEFKCNQSRECIPSFKTCDGRPDCRDESDEDNCVSCTAVEFRCGNLCLPADALCNGTTECPGGEDENNCTLPVSCAANEFQCAGECLPLAVRCNKTAECPDEADEKNCTVSCTADEFRCGNLCLPAAVLCNGTTECPGGEDENNCTLSCAANEFQCAGECFPLAVRCNKTAECPDKTDEKNCTAGGCDSNQFFCDNVCFPDIIRCNNRAECRDETDEANCTVSCTVGEFRCGNLCLPAAVLCNGIAECPGGEDENNCTLACASHEWRCDDGLCIPARLRCNGNDNCHDASDEKGCPRSCSTDEWTCADGVCIPARLRCDGRVNCWDDSDEKDCPTPTTPPSNPTPYCPHGTWRCADNLACIPSYTRCDRVPNCYDGSDERDCKVCPAHQWLCEDQNCIPAAGRCDGLLDCRDGSDEMYCTGGCEPDEFRCSNGRCIRQIWRCDLDDDCGDASDEINCGLFWPGDVCPPRYFPCRDRRSCIPRSQHCNGRRECGDGSDELGCAPPSITKPPPIQKTTPLYSTFDITCQATGVPPPFIIWRFNNRHLPSNCMQTNSGNTSVLRCSNVDRSHQGTYSCEAHNNGGSAMAQPNTFLVIRENPSICFPPTFNDAADTLDECIECFCFGASKTCSSSKRVRTQVPLPETERLEIVTLSFTHLSSEAEATAVGGTSGSDYYYKLPALFLGNLLKSYGGALRYDVLSAAQTQPFTVPDAVLMGKNETLLYFSTQGYSAAVRQTRTVPLEPSYWFMSTMKRKLPSRPRMMVMMQAIDNFFIRAPPHASGVGMAPVDELKLDTAGQEDPASGVGQRAVLVEECECPRGYTGASCESCAEGFGRQTSRLFPYGQCISK